MKPIISILTLFLMPVEAILLRAQPVARDGKESVLIVLRQLEGPVGKRLAATPQSVAVPGEVQAVADRERASLTRAQRESFDARLAIAGATGVLHYPGLNMVRAEIPLAMLSSVESDPAVLSLTPLSGDAQTIATANLGVGVQPAAGAATGRPGPGSEAFQSPLLMTSTGAASEAMGQVPFACQPAMQSGSMPGHMSGLFQPGMAMGQTHGASPAFMPSMPMQGMPGAMPGASFAAPPAGLGGAGSMFQSLLGATSQLGAQAGIAVPRSAGIMLMISGGAQIAQIIAASHKPPCTITLDSTTARIPPAGGQGTFVVNASPSCLWQAQSNDAWLHIDTDGPVVGPGLVRYTASAGAGTSRTGSINIAGIAKMAIKGRTSLTVTQQ